MGYRKVEKRHLWEISRRWQAGQSVSRLEIPRLVSRQKSKPRRRNHSPNDEH